MKKILAAALSLTLCGALFTACGGNKNAADNDVTESITAEATGSAAEKVTEKETEKETEKAAEKETEKETGAETEKAASEAPSSYASLVEFAGSKDVFDLPTDTVPAKDSLTYNFIKSLGMDEKADFYLDAEIPDGSGSITIAMSLENKKIYMNTSGMNIGEDVPDMTIIISDNTLYMLDDAARSGFYMSAGDEDIFAGYDIESVLEELDFDKEMNEAGDVKVCTAEIDGKSYTFEVAETGAGFLFDGDKLYAMVISDNTYDFNALMIHEFSSDVPDSLFEIPSDYELVDMMAAFGQ